MERFVAQYQPAAASWEAIKSKYENNDSCITAGLHGIQLASRLYYADEPAELKMVDDINIDAEVTQKADIDRSQGNDYPATQVRLNVMLTTRDTNKYGLIRL